LKEPFIKINPDEITNPEIMQFWWDINYWLSLSNVRLSELAQKIGTYYFRHPIEKSNVYLICTLIQKLANQPGTSKELLKHLEDVSKRSHFGGIKFFDFSYEDEANNPDNQLSSKVQIMTIHKSKGAEFDYVFLPQMSSKAITLNFENTKIKPENLFLENIKFISGNYKKKSKDEILRSQLEENARLLYVAITRAKHTLYFSCANEYKFYSRTQKHEPCDFLAEEMKEKGAKNAQN